MNPNYNPTAAADAERAMEELTRNTTLQLEKDRAAALPAKVRQDAVNRVLDALDSHPFRKALISQNLTVKEISHPVNGKVIVSLGSLEGAQAVSLEILTDDTTPFEDKGLVFEFMLAPRRVEDDTLKAGSRGHGPEIEDAVCREEPDGSFSFLPPDPLLENPIETQEAVVSVAMPEKEHVTQTFIGEGVEPDTATGDAEIIDATNDSAEQDDPDSLGEDEQARDRGGVE